MTTVWSTFMALGLLAANILGSGHAVLRKRDTRAALGWVALIWLVPGVGVLLYYLLGINRMRRRASALRAGHRPPALTPACEDHELASEALDDRAEPRSLVNLAEQITRSKLTDGNRIDPLENGDAAYPAMLEAIESAEVSIALETYIFDTDAVGRRFVDALEKAHRRGVQVRVLVDAVGARYSWPTVTRLLRRARVPVALFLPALKASTLAFFNLRTHRKVLIVDGTIAFTGGMNIRAGHVLGDAPKHPVVDVHFRVQGPVVARLQEVFAKDWAFTTGEALGGQAWFPPQAACGTTLARVVTDGPDDDFEVLRDLLLGAIACAERSVRIVTPYFLPDAVLISSLGIAARRGVDVQVVLPQVSNLRVVKWASTAQLWQIIEPGCRVYLSPPPFDHTKLMTVDDRWLLLGSTNWDPRSLRLNFELNVECYDAELASAARRLVMNRIATSRELTLADVDGRSLPVRLRDGLARLLSPYL
jgi:cardiolipin synthase A/B